MNTSFHDKTVFVTGGANGIGKGIVKAFCEVGADVFFCDINDEEGNNLCAELKEYKCTFIKADVSNEYALTSAVYKVLEQKGDIDILINNAGIGGFGSILDIKVEDFDKVLRTNLYSAFITSKLLAMHRSKREGHNRYGRIINLSSTRYLMSEPDSEAYAASKGGIVSLTHALAISLSKYHITVNCISPGWIDNGKFGEIREIDHAQHPSGRVGEVGDIARTCLFLCEEANNFINGQNITVDGGMTKKMIYIE